MSNVTRQSAITPTIRRNIWEPVNLINHHPLVMKSSEKLIHLLIAEIWEESYLRWIHIQRRQHSDCLPRPLVGAAVVRGRLPPLQCVAPSSPQSPRVPPPSPPQLSPDSSAPQPTPTSTVPSHLACRPPAADGSHHPPATTQLGVPPIHRPTTMRRIETTTRP